MRILTQIRPTCGKRQKILACLEHYPGISREQRKILVEILGCRRSWEGSLPFFRQFFFVLLTYPGCSSWQLLLLFILSTTRLMRKNIGCFRVVCSTARFFPPRAAFAFTRRGIDLIFHVSFFRARALFAGPQVFILEIGAQFDEISPLVQTNPTS